MLFEIFKNSMRGARCYEYKIAYLFKTVDLLFYLPAAVVEYHGVKNYDLPPIDCGTLV